MNKIKLKFANKITNNKYKLEKKYISLINSLSFSIKELFFSFSKILKSIKSNILEQNNYIFISKCIINNLNNKNYLQEKFKNLFKNVEGINITNKYMINSISNLEESSNLFFQKSKLIFKKMKQLKDSKINIIFRRNERFEENPNFSSINRKNNYLFSSDENIIDHRSFTSKTNYIRNNSNMNQNFISLNNEYETMNDYIKRSKNKKYEKNNKDIIYLSKKLLTGKNRKRVLNHSQDEIITDISNNKLRQKNLKYLISAPHKKVIWSKDKDKNIAKINSNLFSNINNNSISVKYSKINNISKEKKNRELKNYRNDSILEKKNNINNIIEFIENIIEYFYLLKISQNNIINEHNKNNQEKDLDLKIKQSLIKLNYSIFIINDVFIERIHLKRKLNFILNHNDNIEQKLKALIHEKNNRNNTRNSFDNNRDQLINSKELNYIKLIKKLKNDNNNLANINQKIISENRILINQYSLFKNKEKEFPKNLEKNDLNKDITKLIKENNEYKQKITNLIKDNEQLRKIIKNNNNDDKITNGGYYLNNSHISNIINYNTDINNLAKKQNENENMKNLIKENKNLKIKLNKENEIVQKLTEEIESLKLKSIKTLDDIKEKDSIIKSQNLNLENLKNELNKIKNNYTELKNEMEKNSINKEDEIKQLKLSLEEKNEEIKKFKNSEIDKTNQLNEKLDYITKLENLNKEFEKEKSEMKEKSEQQVKEISQLESIINALKEKIKILGKNNDKEIININNNNFNNSKVLSTPSFKSQEEELEEINNFKKENELSLNKKDKNYPFIKINKNAEKDIIISNLEKKSNNDIVNNNPIQTLSSMKINKLYSSNEFKILSDAYYKEFKWYLMKKRNSDEEIENSDSYENLVWVPVINIIDFEKFEYEELGSSSEIANLIKKLEEKENIISKISYKLEKYEKQYENNIKIHNFNFNDTNEEKFKKDENFIFIDKYNNLLQKLNTTEINFKKIQKENFELLKYKKLYLQSNDNNPINKINIENNDEKKKSENSNTNDEIDYYKKKCEELQMLLNVLKEGIKDILMKLVIPKKEKGEVKQILKLFEFSKEEQLIILGDKKN